MKHIINISDLPQICERLAQHVEPCDVILLRGDLGAGKTTFCRYLLSALGVEETIVSPTFTLVQTYVGTKFTVWHFDLYRLKKAQEIYNIGIEDSLAFGISLIEWPEIAMDLLPQEKLIIDLSFTEYDDMRNIVFTGTGKWDMIF